MRTLSFRIPFYTMRTLGMHDVLSQIRASDRCVLPRLFAAHIFHYFEREPVPILRDLFETHQSFALLLVFSEPDTASTL